MHKSSIIGGLAMALAIGLAWGGFQLYQSRFWERNIPYGTLSSLQTMDVYPGQNCPASGCPVAVFVHGGALASGSKDDPINQQIGRLWAPLGITVFVINYRLFPDAVYPAYMEDVAASVDWIKRHAAEYNGDTGQLYLVGHSSGAHLVALLAVDPVYLSRYGLNPAQDLIGVIAVDSDAYDLNLRWQAFGSGDTVVGKAIPHSKITEASVLPHISPTGHYPPLMFFSSTENRASIYEVQQIIPALRAGGNWSDLYSQAYGPSVPNAHLETLADLANPRTEIGNRAFTFMGVNH